MSIVTGEMVERAALAGNGHPSVAKDPFFRMALESVAKQIIEEIIDRADADPKATDETVYWLREVLLPSLKSNP
jgi:hypothetical protein